MHLAFGARALAAVTLGIAVAATPALAATAAPAAISTPAATPTPTRTAAQAGASVTITPGVQHQSHGFRRGPSTTAECQQSLHIACYNPAQIQQAYNLRALYSRGITGKGATIIIIDPYGSPTIARDLRTFDRTEGVPNPP